MNKLSSSIVNRNAKITLSDPWKLGESILWKTLDCIIIAEGVRSESCYGKSGEALIIQLKEKFNFEGLDYEYLQGSTRHDSANLADLLSNEGELFCSFIRIPSTQILAKDKFNLSWWRGGGGLIGTIFLF